ncbi:MAG: glycosyltransferase family 4 protein [Gammaproteobacteria bacterium]|nr:glycosyltransferase family 4 protein [Gammaproteobacteria bacterium]
MRIGFDVAQTCVEKAGCGWYADSLIRAMVKVAPEHEYILYHHFGSWLNQDTSQGTRIDEVSIDNPLLDATADQAGEIWCKVQSGALMAPGQPEIVHACSYNAPRLPEAKLVFTVYDVSFWVHPEFTTEQNRLICQRGVLEALQNADGFVFISESAYREFERVLPGWLDASGKPWQVTLLGAREAAPGIQREIDRSKPLYWLSVGSLEPRKNYEALLDAFEQYQQNSRLRYPLWVAGGKGWRSEHIHRRLRDLEARGLVSYLGYVKDEELADLYAGAVGFIFPSWYEGFGLPVLEAMTQGCPVICSNTASLPEVGGDAVLYVEPDKPLDIVTAMLRIEGDGALRTSLKLASLEQAQQFSWKKTAAITLDFYQSVLGA